MFNTGERSEPENFYYKKVCPSPAHQTFTLDPTSEKSKGGRGVPDPLPMLEREARAQFYKEKICGGCCKGQSTVKQFQQLWSN